MIVKPLKVPAGVRRVSRKELKELSKLPWKRDEELSDVSFEVRLLPDGRALSVLLCDSSATLFPSREAVADAWRQIAERPTGPIDPTRILLPPVNEFIRDVETHAARLGEQIRVPGEVLDRSLGSLVAVDKGVRRLAKAKRITPEVITPLTAYVGLVMLGITGGHWTAEYHERLLVPRRHEDGRVTHEWKETPVPDNNEPRIVTPDGQLLRPFVAAFIEVDRSGSVAAAASVALHPFTHEG